MRRRRSTPAVAASIVVVALLGACDGEEAAEPPATSAPRPTDPRPISDAEAAMRADSLVTSALGSEFETVQMIPFHNEGNHPSDGLVFTVKLPEVRSLPAGMPGWKATGEGYSGPLELSFTEEPSPPMRYFNVWVGNDFTVPFVQPLPDLFGERYEADAKGEPYP